MPLYHLKISQGDISAFLAFAAYLMKSKQKAYCIPLHLTKYVVSKRDAKLQKVINAADIVIADGVPIAWLCRRLGYRSVRRITGIELAEAILSVSREHYWKIFLLGGSQANLERALIYIKEKYSAPLIVGWHHGYIGPRESDQIITQINSLKPDILLLGMGMPQKEYFIADYFNCINSTFWLPVGGAFDIWAQTKQRANPLIQKLGLEWLQRSIYNRNKAKNVFRYGFDFLKDFLFLR